MKLFIVIGFYPEDIPDDIFGIFSTGEKAEELKQKIEGRREDLKATGMNEDFEVFIRIVTLDEPTNDYEDLYNF